MWKAYKDAVASVPPARIRKQTKSTNDRFFVAIRREGFCVGNLVANCVLYIKYMFILFILYIKYKLKAQLLFFTHENIVAFVAAYEIIHLDNNRGSLNIDKKMIFNISINILFI